jgi:hypothetical protein
MERFIPGVVIVLTDVSLAKLHHALFRNQPQLIFLAPRQLEMQLLSDMAMILQFLQCHPQEKLIRGALALV